MSETPKTPDDSIPTSDIERGAFSGAGYRVACGLTWRETNLLPRENEESGPWLIPVEEIHRLAPYSVFAARTKLLTEFGRLAEDPTPEHIKAFADKYGWLQGGRKGATRSVRIPGRSGLHAAEPLSLWKRELRAFRELRRTWHAVSVLRARKQHTDQQRREAADFLQSRVQLDSHGARFERRDESQEAISDAWNEFYALHEECVESDGRMLMQQARHDPTVAAALRRCQALTAAARARGWWKENDPEVLEVLLHNRRTSERTLEIASYYVHDEVNAKLHGHIHIGVLPFRGSIIRHQFRDLLTAIYLLFAFKLAGTHAAERECQRCGVLFLQGRRDQRFCKKSCRELAGYHRRKAATELRA